jgi:hypothetical protein
VTFDPDTQTATFLFSSPLPKGDYTASMAAGAIADAAGNASADSFSNDFFVMAGDANRDRSVDFNDLVKLAQNYNTTGGKTYADGDFTGDGNVDFNDLVILAQHYNTNLPAPGASAAVSAATASAFATDWATATAITTSPVNDTGKKKNAESNPVFSVTPVAKVAPAKSKTSPRRRK